MQTTNEIILQKIQKCKRTGYYLHYSEENGVKYINFISKLTDKTEFTLTMFRVRDMTGSIYKNHSFKLYNRMIQSESEYSQFIKEWEIVILEKRPDFSLLEPILDIVENLNSKFEF